MSGNEEALIKQRITDGNTQVALFQQLEIVHSEYRSEIELNAFRQRFFVGLCTLCTVAALAAIAHRIPVVRLAFGQSAATALAGMLILYRGKQRTRFARNAVMGLERQLGIHILQTTDGLRGDQSERFSVYQLMMGMLAWLFVLDSVLAAIP